MEVNCNCALIHLREIALTLTQGERELCKHLLNLEGFANHHPRAAGNLRKRPLPGFGFPLSRE